MNVTLYGGPMDGRTIVRPPGAATIQFNGISTQQGHFTRYTYNLHTGRYMGAEESTPSPMFAEDTDE